MIRVCPKPTIWNKAYQHLLRYAKTHNCNPPYPPKPLVLAGWVYSNDIEKKDRWDSTVQWAARNNCAELLADISDNDFYFASKLTAYTIGPMGGPMYRPWDSEKKDRPSPTLLEESILKLIGQWPEIIGKELSCSTIPLKFTGKKARRLLVKVYGNANPPWGGWDHLSEDERKRREFTKFRVAVNEAISPHEVDHVSFVVGKQKDG